MAKKKNICSTCRKYNYIDGACKEEARKEVIIKNRLEEIVWYKPNKETECNYYEDMAPDVTTDESNS